MRRTLVTLAASTALLLGAVPAAHAEERSSLSQTIEELPADLKLGSSGVELISSQDSTAEDQQEGSSMLFRDWVTGFAALGIIGAILSAVMSIVR